jgi:hypothetical protein
LSLLSVLGDFSATAALFAKAQRLGSRVLPERCGCAVVAAIHTLQRKLLQRKLSAQAKFSVGTGYNGVSSWTVSAKILTGFPARFPQD